MRYFDVHCHIQEDARCAEKIVRLVSTGGGGGGGHRRRLAVMGTRPSDWPTVHQLMETVKVSPATADTGLLVPCFGYHPWFAHQYQPEHLDQLKRWLLRYPRAIVGECGWDRVATIPLAHLADDLGLRHSASSNDDDKDDNHHDNHHETATDATGGPTERRSSTVAAPLDSPTPQPPPPQPQPQYSRINSFDSHQTLVFQRHFDLAVELQRPMSIHVVQAHGYLLDYLRELADRFPSMRQWKRLSNGEQVAMERSLVPPRIMLHSYSGPTDLLRQLLKLRGGIGARIYISLSTIIHRRLPEERVHDLMRAIPDDRLLLESDVHDLDLVPQAIHELAQWVSQVRGWSLEETHQKTWENACRFYGMDMDGEYK